MSSFWTRTKTLGIELPPVIRSCFIQDLFNIPSPSQKISLRRICSFRSSDKELKYYEKFYNENKALKYLCLRGFYMKQIHMFKKCTHLFLSIV